MTGTHHHLIFPSGGIVMDRIIGAFTFRRGVYAEVEQDESFTTTAWLIVIVVSILNQIGSNSFDSFGGWLLGVIVGTVFVIIGFALSAWIISFVGRAVFNAEVTFRELVRTVGLAYVWQAVGLLGILGNLLPSLNCIFGLAIAAGVILWLVAAFMAAKEALDLEWVQTIITVFLGVIVYVVILFIAGAVLLALGITGGAILSAF
jgi:hypothetical protein